MVAGPSADTLVGCPVFPVRLDCWHCSSRALQESASNGCGSSLSGSDSFLSAISSTSAALRAQIRVECLDTLVFFDWEKTAFTIAVALTVFANFYYPYLKASWGGGAPINVTIYFNKDSAIRPSQALVAQLVDESDEGFYIVGPQETKAIYVPRTAVALLYFSDKVSDSAILVARP